MNNSKIDEVETEVLRIVSVLLEGDEGLLNDVKDSISDLADIETQLNNIYECLGMLKTSIDNKKELDCSSVLMKMRSNILDIESTSSNFADCMLSVSKHLTLIAREKAGKSLARLTLKELLVKNQQIEFGTFMDELHWSQTFNFEKFEHLSNALSEQHECDLELLSLSLGIYSEVMKKIIFHNDPTDGFLINNLDEQMYLEMMQVVEVFKESLIR